MNRARALSRPALTAQECLARRYAGVLSPALWRLYGEHRDLYDQPENRALLSHAVFSAYLALRALDLGAEAERAIGAAQRRALREGRL